MPTFLIAIGSFAGFIIAYNTYGRWIANKIFNLDPDVPVPSREMEDGIDFVPSKRSIVFGHHFTSIAGTGPIVGPAIAVFWGWLPALAWVVFGSIFIGAVHDFGALVVSLRNRGQTVGEIAGRLISPRTKLLFLFALFFALTVVLAIFGLVIAIIFKTYPESVLAVWVSLPIAIVFGIMMRKGAEQLLLMSAISLVLIYVAIYFGAYHLPITLPVSNPIVGWTIILLIYCAIASVLPVSWLLQPRDYVNSHQLFVALFLLVVGLIIASLTGKADLLASTPAITQELPKNTPPIWPFLFITIACGAISGFHCLVSSGTSSKQLANEKDALSIGYGAMLLEGALAVVVILACCAGVGMGKFTKESTILLNGTQQISYQPVLNEATGEPLVDREAWRKTYQLGEEKSWSSFTLTSKIGAFVEGGANFLNVLGLPLKLGIGIIAVLVACFAATTLDSATRLQRYVIQELGDTLKIPPLKNIYIATLVAVTLGGIIAMLKGPAGMGSGGLLLWPLFGATNQLLAGLAFMVTTFYLWRRNKPIGFVLIPMIFMIVLPAWALIWQLFNAQSGWWWSSDKYLVATIGTITLGLQLWMVVEAMLIWPKAKGILETPLPPLTESDTRLKASGGRSC
ncbi:carbon starvation protein A [Mariniblastus sp.]|nr:carbon starvation protein A [Mariniblastus sp.]MDA7901992.1 carbon starvation protein A [bacterium]MDA7906698.1 carbon starvation protein A [Mariniblastus sp.]MDA7925730.1 carbon starvation protein A [Mariniblastus sp.]